MNKKFHVILCFLLIISDFSVKAQVSASQTGMKLFDDYSPDKTGATDISDLLQTAVDWCIANTKTLYIAPGTYKVSKQILGTIFPGRDCGNQDGTNSLNIVGDAYNRPVIVLQDGATGFQSATSSGCKAVIQIQHTLGLSNEDCVYWSTVKNIDFDLGNNAGAVALKFPAAQNSHVTNLKVYGTDFFAGFTGLPGANMTNSNLEVVGGRYGFYLVSNSVGASLFGIVCRDQSVAGLYLQIGKGTSIIGLEVTGCKGNAVVSRTGSNAYQGNINITDARIEMANSANYAFSIGDRAISLRNVFLTGTKNIVTANTLLWTEPTITNWLRIKDYCFTPASISGVTTNNFIDGVKLTNPIKDISFENTAPADLISVNTAHQIYAFNTPCAKSVTEYGAIPDDTNDDYTAIQNAINNNDIVFLPAGDYRLSKPLQLKNGSVLIGEAGKRSHLVPQLSPSASSRTWLVITPNVQGYVAIQDMGFQNTDVDYIGAIKWQTSDGFFQNVKNYFASTQGERNKHNFEFTGNAGGRFYGIAEDTQIYSTRSAPVSTDFRKVFLSNTTNPITFYGLNVERGGVQYGQPQNPFVEMINCKNVRVYGNKSESDGIIYQLDNCQNVTINSITTHMLSPAVIPSDSSIIRLKNGTTDVEINQIYSPNISPTMIMIDDVFDVAHRGNYLGTYRLGTYNPDLFHFATSTPTQYENSVKVYPTVTNDKIFFTGAEITQIRLITIDGRNVNVNFAGNANYIDISNQREGIYVLQLVTNDRKSHYFKIVKK